MYTCPVLDVSIWSGGEAATTCPWLPVLTADVSSEYAPGPSCGEQQLLIRQPDGAKDEAILGRLFRSEHL